MEIMYGMLFVSIHLESNEDLIVRLVIGTDLAEFLRSFSTPSASCNNMYRDKDTFKLLLHDPKVIPYFFLFPLKA